MKITDTVRRFTQAAAKATEAADAATAAATEADNAAAAAVESETALEQRIMAGEDVDPNALDKATTSTRFAKLKAVAARRAAEKATEAAEEARQAREVEEAKATLDRLLSDTALQPVQDAYIAAVDSIRNLIATVEQRMTDEDAIASAQATSPDERAFNTAAWKVRHPYFADQGVDWLRVAIEEALNFRARPKIMGGAGGSTAQTREWPMSFHRIQEIL
ncbi:hypothetical protein JWS13_17630 [Rhodococcus pseudokoreensis]|uniref:Uncharacterized protein n=1 Tax=Rhodococcus pseudokoreensis TaxID=2811421 RepID=A0A974ZTW8_9NOCA|nr:hypothetical protein [Rhodococcus pseudokoreensis]QSE90310.1 hypothetical protein JWS13_17630 [Rhodococcus pseudokoreensis]